MHHDHDVCARGESLAIAGLLVAAIAVIGIVDKGQHAEPAGESGGPVLAGVIDKDLDVDHVGQFAHRLFQSQFGVVGGHHNRNSLSVDHGFSS